MFLKYQTLHYNGGNTLPFVAPKVGCYSAMVLQYKVQVATVHLGVANVSQVGSRLSEIKTQFKIGSLKYQHLSRFHPGQTVVAAGQSGVAEFANTGLQTGQTGFCLFLDYLLPLGSFVAEVVAACFPQPSKLLHEIL